MLTPLQIMKRPMRKVREWYKSSEWALRKRLRFEGASFPPKPPQCTWLNSALKTRKDADEALAEVRACGLPPHGDSPKNWDGVSALHFVLERTTRNARVLEVGAELYSVMLPWLYLYGYRNLRGIDLVFDRPVRHGPILYEHGDLTRTRFDDNSFDVVLCMSVIEHGVDPTAYFREMSRLLRPGGILITSADYWADPINTRGQVAYGVPIKIFARQDIEEMLTIAKGLGFKTTGEVDLECEEKCVRWDRYELTYTFVNFALERAGKN
jgi:SAM-dependent methyltransferase